MEILNQGFDHVEYVLNDVRPMARTFERLGFEQIGQRDSQSDCTQSVVYAQGVVRIILTQPTPGVKRPEKECHSVEFLKRQDEGVCVLAIEVDNAEKAFEDAVKNGAKAALEPVTWKCESGKVTRAEVWTPGLVRYALMERKAYQGFHQPGPMDLRLEVSRLVSPSPLHIHQIDHLTNNVGIGEMKEWVEWYKKVFGFVVTRHFDIRTGRTGLISDVVESPNRKIKVPINEATEPESQVQEFVNRLKGSGVQHLALLTTDIQSSLRAMRKQAFKFLTVPSTYYEAVPTRVPGVTEKLADLEELGILLDGDASGYLLQIFSEEILGPFFFEYIQRKGNEGFGEGNFRALFEAIERDQIKRGVLKA